MPCSTVLSDRNDNYVSDLRLFIAKQWVLATADTYLGTPRRAFLWGLATTRLLATDAQIDVQNAPVDLQLVTPKLAETLIQQC
jgi:hypothetical protein